jgi:hypothetical protein
MYIGRLQLQWQFQTSMYIVSCVSSSSERAYLSLLQKNLPLPPSTLQSRRRSIHFHPHSYLPHRKIPPLQKMPYPKTRLFRGFLTCRSSGPPILALHPAPQRPARSLAHPKRRSRRTPALARGTMHDQNHNQSFARLTLTRMDIAKGGSCQLYKDRLLSRAQRSLDQLPSVQLALQT